MTLNEKLKMNFKSVVEDKENYSWATHRFVINGCYEWIRIEIKNMNNEGIIAIRNFSNNKEPKFCFTVNKSIELLKELISEEKRKRRN